MWTGDRKACRWTTSSGRYTARSPNPDNKEEEAEYERRWYGARQIVWDIKDDYWKLIVAVPGSKDWKSEEWWRGFVWKLDLGSEFNKKMFDIFVQVTKEREELIEFLEKVDERARASGREVDEELKKLVEQAEARRKKGKDYFP